MTVEEARALDAVEHRSKTISPRLRLQALLQAQLLESRIAEFPEMQPGVRTILQQSADVLNEVAK